MLPDVVPGSTIGGVLWCCLILQLFTKWPGLVSGFYLTISVYREVNVTMDVQQTVGYCASTCAVRLDRLDDIAREYDVLLFYITCVVLKEDTKAWPWEL